MSLFLMDFRYSTIGFFSMRLAVVRELGFNPQLLSLIIYLFLFLRFCKDSSSYTALDLRESAARGYNLTVDRLALSLLG